MAVHADPSSTSMRTGSERPSAADRWPIVVPRAPDELDATTAAGFTWRAGWLRGPAHDVAMALLWLPFAVVAYAVADEPDHLRWLVSATLLFYLGSTAVLLVVLAVAPVVGYVGYVGAHAAEYVLVVRWRIGRAAERAAIGDRVGAVARRVGSNGTVGLYAAAVAALIDGLRRFDGSDVAGAIVLALGGLHLLFDGFIWRSPRPAPGGAADHSRRVVQGP
jgi:hypothetical protein